MTCISYIIACTLANFLLMLCLPKSACPSIITKKKTKQQQQQRLSPKMLESVVDPQKTKVES